jgi:hypothetical protein
MCFDRESARLHLPARPLVGPDELSTGRSVTSGTVQACLASTLAPPTIFALVSRTLNVSSHGYDGLRRAAFDEIAEDSLGRSLRPGETSAVVFDQS